MNRNNVLILTVILASVLFVSGCVGQAAETGNKTLENTEKAVVTINSNGFNPETITIKKGTTIIWINSESNEHWPATDPHPRHTGYPGVNYGDGKNYDTSLGCVSKGNPKPGAFDSCKGLGNGEKFEFTFDFPGEWKYHDHLNPTLKGSVIVEQ